MYKKISTNIVLVTVLVLLTPSWAVAEPSVGALGVTSTGVKTQELPWFDVWFEDFVAWIGRALTGADLTAAKASRDDLRNDQEPEKPAPSDPGVVLLPMAGADGNPDG